MNLVPPRASWFSRLFRCGRAHCWLFLLLAINGCATLFPEHDAVARYERTKAELDRASRAGGGFEEEDLERSRGKLPELSDFAPENLKGTISRYTGYGPAPEQADQLYQEGKTLYDEAVDLRNRGQSADAASTFLAAAARFSDAAKRFPKSSVSQNGLFYAGEAYFFADHYPNANECYEKLVKEHPNSRHIDEVQRRRFAIAQYWLEHYRREKPNFYEVNLTDSSKPWNSYFSNAMRVFDRIRLDDPAGKLADDATLAMASAHFAEGRFGRADEYFTDLRKTFPSSEHQFTAHFVGLKAKLLTYQGPDYGGAVLDECEKLIQTIRKQFPAEAERERKYLATAFAEVRYRKAEREYLMAEYFRGKAEHGAARYYYAIVIKDFVDTKFAEQAQERLAQIDGLPEIPPQRFEWLVKAFPREQNVQPLIATDKPKTKLR